MKWISVEESMPKDDKDLCGHDWVFVFGTTDGYELVGIAQYQHEQWVIMSSKGANGCSGLYFFNTDDISHWCPVQYPE